MPIMTLDAKTALILVDLQHAIVNRPLAHSSTEVVKNARLLADAFRANGLPVVLVNVAGVAPGRAEQSRPASFPPEAIQLVPELGQQPGDIAVTKRTWGAFTQTGLAERLREQGVTQVVVGGIATSLGVESTARQAHELGFNVTLATDAMTDTSTEAHDNSVKRIFPRLGETASSAEIVARLGQSAA
jgi:nicotinamidase-related amidase